MAEECAQIALLYKSGFCKIAALESLDSHGGCFADRDPSLMKPAAIQSYWVGCKIGLWQWNCTVAADIYEELETSSVHQRGRVLKERLLSPLLQSKS